MDWSDVLMAQCFNTEQQGQRAIHFALENRRFEAVQLILERCLEYFGKDVAYKLANDHGGREDGNTPLHICAAAGGEKSVYLLKEIYKVSARKQNKASATPLFLAAHLGHTKVVMRLVDLDNPKKTSEYLRKKNKKGASPLLAAVGNGHVSTVKVLLKLGSNIKSTNGDDQNVFYTAAEQNHPQVLQTLIDHNEKIADELMVQPDHKGNTAFHIAARLGHETIMEMLIELRLKYDKSDTKSTQTLDSIFQFEFDAMANHNGQTPLHLACKQGDEKNHFSDNKSKLEFDE
jgi:ankyrin repeat protein